MKGISLFSICFLLTVAQTSRANWCTEVIARIFSPSPTRQAREAERTITLEHAFRFFIGMNGRETSAMEVKRSRISDLVFRSLKFDRKWVTINYLKTMFREMQQSYHTLQRNYQLETELKAILADLRAGTDATSRFRTFLETSGVDHAGALAAVAAGDTAQMTQACEELLVAFDRHNNRLARLIHLHWDEYQAAIGMLNSVAKGEDRLGTQAKEVLARLQSEELLRRYFNSINAPAADRRTPTNADFQGVLDDPRYWRAERARLRRDGARELLHFVISISPTNAVFKMIDRIIGRIPGIDVPKIRAFFNLLEVEKIQLVHSGDIQRILNGSKDAKERVDMLELLNVGTDDNLLWAFARRLDARADWNAMKAEANTREDKTLYNKMLAADEKRRVSGDAVLWRTSSNRVIRVLLDAMAYSGGGYLAYQFWPQDEEAEADSLLDDSKTVIQFLEQDPEGRPVLERYRAAHPR